MRSASHYAHGRLSWLVVIEVLIVITSISVAYWIQLPTFRSNLPIFTGLAFVASTLLALTACGLYDNEQPQSFRAIAQRIFMAQFLALLALSFLFFLYRPLAVGRGLILIASVISTLGILLFRFWANQRRLLAIPKRRIVVIGSDHDTRSLEAVMSEHSPSTMRSISSFVPLNQIIAQSGLNKPDDIIDYLLSAEQTSELVVASKERRNSGVPMQLLLRSKLHGLAIDDTVSFFERELGVIKIDHLRISWLVFGSGFDQGAARAVWKRAFDLVMSGALLIVAIPLIGLSAIAIYLETGRPIFFRQTRTGAFGKPFEILKLRSMRVDAEVDGVARWAKKNDDRITPLGRVLRLTRLDELPQLFNVLRGEMSFVGPRPERPVFVEQLIEDVPYYEIRHYVKPGLTGWAQVNLPYGDSVEGAIRKLEFDLYYVKNNSLFFDLLIFFDTVRVVLRGKGQ